jgi:lipoprotein-releasing system permease protein
MMRLAISAVSLSVATMIVTIATVKGFQNGIRNKVVQVHGSYIVDHAANVEGAEPMVVSSIHLPKFVNQAQSPQGILPAGVKNMAISASKACIVKGDSELDGVVAKGMSHRDFQFGMSGFVTKRCAGAEPDSKWVYISQAMADRLRLDTGDQLTLVFFVNDSFGRGRPRAARPLIAGLFETGIEQIDNQVVYTDLSLVQKYLDVKPGFTQIEIWEADHTPIDPLALSMQLPAGMLRISDSRQFHRQIYDWLAILNTNVWVILILMALVAIIAMSTILLILMVEKTAFVGIAQAMGSSIGQIQRVFLWQSAYIVSIGVVLGNLLAIALCLFQDKTHFLTLNQDVYFVKYVMVDLDPWSILLVNVGIIAASIIAAVLPVQWIKRMTPSRAIRFQ